MNGAEQPFGRYTLLEKIAAGGMGEVYLAKALGAAGFEKKIVIKKILSHLSQDRSFVDRFIDEAKILVKLTHGNIVPVFDMGVVEGDYYIAMEYIDGKDLRDILRFCKVQKQNLSVPTTLYIINEVTKGLDYAHRKADDQGRSLNIIHRDVSPSNILISRDGQVKLLDFGIAKARDRLSQSISGTLHGKFQYMSPEQARGETVDRRSDIFSLGVVAYEMLTGVRPFEEESDIKTLEAVKTRDIEPPSKHNPAVPEDLEQVIMRCLSKDKAARYNTVQDLQKELLPLLYSQEEPVTSSLVVRELAAYFGRLPRQKPSQSLDDILQQGLDEKERQQPVAILAPGADEAPRGITQTRGREPSATPLEKGQEAPPATATFTPQVTPPPGVSTATFPASSTSEDKGFTPQTYTPITGSGVYPPGGSIFNRILIVGLLAAIAVLLYLNLRNLGSDPEESMKESPDAVAEAKTDGMVAQVEDVSTSAPADAAEQQPETTGDGEQPASQKTVTVRFRGIPSGTRVLVDGQPVSLGAGGELTVPTTGRRVVFEHSRLGRAVVDVPDGTREKQSFKVKLEVQKDWAEVTVEPSSATLYVGTRKIGVGKGRVRVRRGGAAKKVTAKLKGYRPASGKVSFDRKRLQLELKKLVIGTIKFRVTPYRGVVVTIDGGPVQPDDNGLVTRRVEAGVVHHVVATYKGKRVQKSIVVNKGETKALGTLDLTAVDSK